MDGSYIDVEPVTGTTLAGKQRFGLYAKTHTGQIFNKKVKAGQIVPIYSGDGGGAADKETMEGFKQLFYFFAVSMPGIVGLLNAFGIISLILGVCCCGFGGRFITKKDNGDATVQQKDLQLSQI